MGFGYWLNFYFFGLNLIKPRQNNAPNLRSKLTLNFVEEKIVAILKGVPWTLTSRYVNVNGFYEYPQVSPLQTMTTLW